MDELLTDLKSYDKDKAFRREGKAGGRLRGRWRQKGHVSYSGQEMRRRKQAPVGPAYKGKGRSSRGGMW